MAVTPTPRRARLWTPRRRRSSPRSRTSRAEKFTAKKWWKSCSKVMCPYKPATSSAWVARTRTCQPAPTSDGWQTTNHPNHQLARVLCDRTAVDKRCGFHAMHYGICAKVSKAASQEPCSAVELWAPEGVIIWILRPFFAVAKPQLAHVGGQRGKGKDQAALVRGSHRDKAAVGTCMSARSG